MKNTVNEIGKELIGSVAESAKDAAKDAAKEATTTVVKSAVTAILPKLMIAVAVLVLLGGGIGITAHLVKKDNSLKIVDTPNVVEKIRKISEFTTYTYIEEFVLTNSKTVAKEGGLLSIFKRNDVPDSSRSEIVLITRGKVRAGYDLSKITEQHLRVSNDTLDILLPAPEVFDAIINPSDNEVFIEEGEWSHEEITAMQVNCRERLLKNALDYGILDNANKYGEEKIKSLFMSFGFKEVRIGW